MMKQSIGSYLISFKIISFISREIGFEITLDVKAPLSVSIEIDLGVDF